MVCETGIETSSFANQDAEVTSPEQHSTSAERRAPPAATVARLLTDAVNRLRAAGCDTPRTDARLLLSQVTGAVKETLLAHPQRPVGESDRRRFEALLQRRLRREPLPYLLGWWEFLGMRLRVSPATLIPRAETETLVETVAAALADAPHPRILDVGTGCGCIAVGLATLLPAAAIVALEPSAAALAVATENVAAFSLAERVELRPGRFPEAAGAEPYDAIVSNPPYIRTAELAALQPEVRDFEPRLALDGGAEGLDVLEPLARCSPGLLRREGLLAVEVADGQAQRVLDLLAEAGGWGEANCVHDLSGKPRVVLARRAVASR